MPDLLGNRARSGVHLRRESLVVLHERHDASIGCGVAEARERALATEAIRHPMCDV